MPLIFQYQIFLLLYLTGDPDECQNIDAYDMNYLSDLGLIEVSEDLPKITERGRQVLSDWSRP